MLHEFVNLVEATAELYKKMGSAKKINKLVINEDIFFSISKDPKFWSIEQFKTQIFTATPILNKFLCVSLGKSLTIVPSRNELFFKLEE